MDAQALNAWTKNRWTPPSDEYERRIPETEERAWAREKATQFRDKAVDIAKDEVAQRIIFGSALGTGAYFGRNSLGLTAYPAILMALGAHRLTQPVATGLLRLTESPLGKAAAKAAEVVDKVKEFW